MAQHSTVISAVVTEFSEELSVAIMREKYGSKMTPEVNQCIANCTGNNSRRESGHDNTDIIANTINVERARSNAIKEAREKFI